LNLSRRLELVIARASGLSAWQFVMPAMAVAFLFGLIATTIYNPVAALLFERSKNLEVELSGNAAGQASAAGFWVRQLSGDRQSIIKAATSRNQGATLDTVTVFSFDTAGHFLERVDAKSAVLEKGHWRLDDARVYPLNGQARDYDSYLLNTELT